MKIKWIIGLLIVPSVAYGQNAVELLRPMHRAKSAFIVRTINVPISCGAQAIRVGQLNKNYSVRTIPGRVSVEIEREILANSLKNPIKVYGPYKYTKAFSKASRNPLLVNSGYVTEWKEINEVTGFNGAHHLISRSTIKLIYLDLKSEGKEVRLTEMEQNAPSIFHPLHGNPAYRAVFHDTEQQYYDYKRFGMKVTVASLLERIDEVNVALGLQPYPAEYLDGLLKETELWCEYWGINWSNETK